ncbi:MAG: YgaP family membrane protein [Flavisolibacter sp.]
MKSNLGTTDKIIRIIIALVIGVLYFTNNISGIIGTILLIVGIILVLTVLINFCPLYFLLGLRSNKKA